MKKLTLQEMTDAQQMRVRTRIGQERKKLGRELTNAEMKFVGQVISSSNKSPSITLLYNIVILTYHTVENSI